MIKPLALLVSALTAAAAVAQPAGDYIEHYDTLYNSLTIQRTGTLVELRARAHGSEALESAVDLADPQRLVVAYTRTLFAGLFFQPKPERVLMIGLGGAGFHRLFNAAYPRTLLQTVELDQKVLDLCKSHLAFTPTAQTPVAIVDGRQFVKRDRTKWDWLILDAFRGGFVPPHLKTQEFYRECAARLSERGVFITNLHATSELFYSDLKTLRTVFPQVVLFTVKGRGNSIVCAVNYRTPAVTSPLGWPTPDQLAQPAFANHLRLDRIRDERADLPEREIASARLLTDDFSPVEFLDAIKTNNTKNR